MAIQGRSRSSISWELKANEGLILPQNNNIGVNSEDSEETGTNSTKVAIFDHLTLIWHPITRINLSLPETRASALYFYADSKGTS